MQNEVVCANLMFPFLLSYYVKAFDYMIKCSFFPTGPHSVHRMDIQGGKILAILTVINLVFPIIGRSARRCKVNIFFKTNVFKYIHFCT